MKIGISIGFFAAIFECNLQKRWFNVCICIHHCYSIMYMHNTSRKKDGMHATCLYRNFPDIACVLRITMLGGGGA
jgi:hypothetical protein